jgi:hypothetical protein
VAAPAGAAPAGAATAGEAAELLRAAALGTRSFLDQVRSLDQPHGYAVWHSADHASFRSPRAATDAAAEVARQLARAFEWGLGDEGIDRVVGLLAEREGDPVFALEVLRLAGHSPSGFGAALWAMSVAPQHQRGQVDELARRLGGVLAVANRASPGLVTYRTVMADLQRATGGDAAQLAFVPLLFAATATPFTRSFLAPMVQELVVRPNRERQEAGRALPPTFVHDGRGQLDTRALALEALSHSPRASAAFLRGAGPDGVPNLHRLIGDEVLDPDGPGLLDGDGGRALASVIDAGTVAPVGRVGPWARVSAQERSAAAGAVVSAFGDRAHVLGWELPDALHRSLSELAIRTLPSFQLAPPSFGDVVLEVPTSAAPVPDREQGVRFLSLLFTRRASEDAVVGAARRHIEATSARLGPEDHQGHLGLGLLWGALADASLGGRLVHAIVQDHARDEQRSAWELGERVVAHVVGAKIAAAVVGPVGGWFTTEVAQDPVQDEGADVVSSLSRPLEDELLPDEQRTEAVLAEAAELVDRRRDELASLVAAEPGSRSWSAAHGGFDGGVGPEVRPPGYAEPDPALLVELDAVLDASEDGDEAEAIEPVVRVLDGPPTPGAGS